MQARIFQLALVAAVLIAAPVFADPIVTLQYTPEIIAGVDAYDLFYSSSPGGEFLNYRVITETTNGAFLLDPNRGSAAQGFHYDDTTDGPRVDFWVNTVYSALGFDVPTLSVATYDAISPGQDAIPTAKIDWTVFDVNGDDDNDMSGDVPDPGNPLYMAPYHLVRILMTSQKVGGVLRPDGQRPTGYVDIRAFDDVTFEQDGVTPKAFLGLCTLGDNGPTGNMCGVPEPSTALLIGLAMIGLVGFARRKTA